MAAERRATYADLEAVPEHLVAEIIDGELMTHPRPTPRHTIAASALNGALIGPFQNALGGPGGWIFATEPELHLERQVVVPDWRHGVENGSTFIPKRSSSKRRRTGSARFCRHRPKSATGPSSAASTEKQGSVTSGISTPGKNCWRPSFSRTRTGFWTAPGHPPTTSVPRPSTPFRFRSRTCGRSTGRSGSTRARKPLSSEIDRCRSTSPCPLCRRPWRRATSPSGW